MATFGVVLDACALYPARLRDTLLRSAERRLYRPQWSADILEELRRNLVENAQVSEFKAQRLLDTMREAFQYAAVDGYQQLISAMPTKPEDRHVAAAAVVSHCQVIVTMNLRHFPADALALLGIEPQSPDTFLMHLYDLHPQVMQSVISDLVKGLTRPPLSAEQVLTQLSKCAPSFVQHYRQSVLSIS